MVSGGEGRVNRSLFIKAVIKLTIADASVRNTNVHFSIFLESVITSTNAFFLLSFNGL